MAANNLFAQQNLLLNGNFEDINICQEYTAECGVEAWFYMNATHIQMAKLVTKNINLGSNTLTVSYNRTIDNNFVPIIGTLLPCKLQLGQRYHFKGIFSAQLNAKLNLAIGIAMGQHFYVPRKIFSQNISPDSISDISKIEGEKDLYEFDYAFTANGNEKYLTFGAYTNEIADNGKHAIHGIDVISLTVDNFELVSENKNEQPCADWEINKKLIYDYNYRHKILDYTLYGKGELPIPILKNDSGSFTQIIIPKPIKKSDTIRLGDVLFDFNEAQLKASAINILQKVFTTTNSQNIDSIFVEGHTDSIGTDAKNFALSRNRCTSVKTWLLKENILKADKIFIHPFGRTKPIATNSTAAGRALNRRVELIIFRK